MMNPDAALDCHADLQGCVISFPEVRARGVAESRPRFENGDAVSPEGRRESHTSRRSGQGIAAARSSLTLTGVCSVASCLRASLPPHSPSRYGHRLRSITGTQATEHRRTR